MNLRNFMYNMCKSVIFSRLEHFSILKIQIQTDLDVFWYLNSTFYF